MLTVNSSCQNRREFGDRFIPKRSFLDIDLIQHKFSSHIEELTQGTDILCQEVKTGRFSSYQENLRNILLPNANKYSRILPLFVCKEIKVKTAEKVKHWPVNARKRPFITTPETVLDLPAFSTNIDVDLLDWGPSDYIAAIISRSIYLWHAPTNRIHQYRMWTNSLDGLSRIKWHPNDKLLACAFFNGSLQMFDVEKGKTFGNRKNMCHPNCYKTAIDFHPLHHTLAAGCSQGTISKFNTDLSCIASYQLHRRSVLVIVYSCDGMYLASSGNDQQVFITRLNEVIFSIKLDSLCRALAWHPWRSSYLVIGDTGGKMMLRNVAINETLATYTPEVDCQTAILCLSFSKKTAELVSSHGFNTETNCTQLNVLESLDRVVDRINCIGPTFYLKWNPEGTKLATVGQDEVIRIWNFVPKTKDQNKRFSKGNKLGTVKNTNMEVQYTNMLNFLR